MQPRVDALCGNGGRERGGQLHTLYDEVLPRLGGFHIGPDQSTLWILLADVSEHCGLSAEYAFRH